MNVFKLTLKRILKSPIRMSILIVSPILFVMFFAFTVDESISIGISDNDQSYFSDALIESLEENIKVVKFDEAHIVSAISEFQAQYILKIPEGFQDKLLAGENVELNSYYAVDALIHESMSDMIDARVAQLKVIGEASQGNLSLAKKIHQDYQGKVFKVENVEENTGGDFRFQLSIGFLIQFIIYMSIVTTGILLDDKVDGTYYRTFFAPISMRNYLIQQVSAFILIGIIQVSAVISFIGFMLFSKEGTVDISLLLNGWIVMVIFAFVAIAMSLFIVNLVNSQAVAYSLIGVLTTPLVMLGGCYWSREMMPNVMQRIGDFLPTTYAMDSVIRLIRGQDFTQIIGNLGILVLFGVLFTIAGTLKKADVVK